MADKRRASPALPTPTKRPKYAPKSQTSEKRPRGPATTTPRKRPAKSDCFPSPPKDLSDDEPSPTQGGAGAKGRHTRDAREYAEQVLTNMSVALTGARPGETIKGYRNKTKACLPACLPVILASLFRCASTSTVLPFDQGAGHQSLLRWCHNTNTVDFPPDVCNQRCKMTDNVMAPAEDGVW